MSSALRRSACALGAVALLLSPVLAMARPAATPVAAPAAAPAAVIAHALADPTRSDADRALDAGRKPAEILAFAAFRKGETVADWGAGNGYYSTLIGDLVGPKGRVYAVGIAANVDDKVWQPLLARHPAISPLFVTGETQVLAPGSLDAIFAHLEYHDLYWSSDKWHYPVRDVPAVLRNWYAALKPGGRAIVIDHVGPAGDPREIADKYHRIDPARVRADFAAAGFTFDGESAALHRDDDPHTVGVFDSSVKGHTDRFVFRFVKPR